jgi:hypothetical protein
VNRRCCFYSGQIFSSNIFVLKTSLVQRDAATDIPNTIRVNEDYAVTDGVNTHVVLIPKYTSDEWSLPEQLLEVVVTTIIATATVSATTNIRYRQELSKCSAE